MTTEQGGHRDRPPKTHHPRSPAEESILELAKDLYAAKVSSTPKDSGHERLHGFARIAYPSRIPRPSPEQPKQEVEQIAQMHHLDVLCKEMSYDERRRKFFANHLWQKLYQSNVSDEEELVSVIRVFIRKYPKPQPRPVIDREDD
jgi:hypothetical protein